MCLYVCISPREGNGNPLQCSCLEYSMDREAQRATVHGVARLRHYWATKPPHTRVQISCRFCFSAEPWLIQKCICCPKPTIFTIILHIKVCWALIKPTQEACYSAHGLNIIQNYGPSKCKSSYIADVLTKVTSLLFLLGKQSLSGSKKPSGPKQNKDKTG